MSEWPTVPLREAGITLIDCDHRTPAAMPVGYPYVTIPQLDDGHIDISTARRISREDFEAWTRKALPLQHDVVLSRRTNPGVTAYVPEGLEFALGQNLVLLRSDGQTVYPPFLRWLVRGPNWWAQIEQFLNVGAVFDSLKCADIPSFRLPIPPMKDQRRIAEILGALDDKIELNRRLAEQLDGAARAIFHEWFIADPAAASWPVASLAEVFEVNPSRPLSRIAPAPYLDMANMPTSGPSALGVATRIPGSGARFENGDTLLARITPCLENGKTALVDFLPPGERGWGSTEYIVLRPREPLPEPFAYCLARHPDFVSYAVARMNGSSGRQRVSAAAIREFEIRTPPPELAARFGNVVGPMFDRIAVARRESRTLVALRDALLPRLLGGEASPSFGRGQVA